MELDAVTHNVPVVMLDRVIAVKNGATDRGE
jgi:hypothetical protein